MPRKKGKGRSPKQKGRGRSRKVTKKQNQMKPQFVTTEPDSDDEETQFEEQPTMEEIDIKEEDDDNEVLDDNMFLAIENEMKLIENANRMAQEKQVECVTLLDEPSTSHGNISMACDLSQPPYMINNRPSIGSVAQPQLIVDSQPEDDIVPTVNRSLLIPRSTINQSIVHLPLLEDTDLIVEQPKKFIQLSSSSQSMQPQIILKRLPQSSKTCEYCGTQYSNTHCCKQRYNCYRCHTKYIESKLFAYHLENTHDVSSSQNEFKTFLDINFRDYKLTAEKCFLCRKQFKFLHDLASHVKLDHKLCRVCGVRLPTDDKASLHIERHDKLFVHIYQCSVCGMESPLYQLAAIHKESHSSPYTTFKQLERKNKELNCPYYCYYFTSSFHSMIFHISLHQPKRCSKCKRYYLPFARHIFDQRFNECSVCNPIPITTELLPLDEQSHMKLEFATITNLIGATSSKRVAKVPKTRGSVHAPLRREMVTHKPARHMADSVISYPCLYCREVFHAGMELYSHIRTKHIVCAICCKKFSTVPKLDEHFVDTHTM